MNVTPGTTRITADGIVGVQNQPFRVYAVSLISGGTASTLTLRNGPLVTSTIQEQVDGVASQAVTKNYAGGLLFPAGLFADVDANISFADIVGTTEF